MNQSSLINPNLPQQQQQQQQLQQQQQQQQQNQLNASNGTSVQQPNQPQQQIYQQVIPPQFVGNSSGVPQQYYLNPQGLQAIQGPDGTIINYVQPNNPNSPQRNRYLNQPQPTLLQPPSQVSNGNNAPNQNQNNQSQPQPQIQQSYNQPQQLILTTDQFGNSVYVVAQPQSQPGLYPQYQPQQSQPQNVNVQQSQPTYLVGNDGAPVGGPPKVNLMQIKQEIQQS